MIDNLTRESLRSWFIGRYYETQPSPDYAAGYARLRSSGELTAETLRDDIRSMLADLGMPGRNSSLCLFASLLGNVLAQADFEDLLASVDAYAFYSAEEHE